MKAQRLHDAKIERGLAEEDFCSPLIDLGFGDYYEIRTDEYDNSVEFDGVVDGAVLSHEHQLYIRESGFSRAWLNHRDGSETYYFWDGLPAGHSMTGSRARLGLVAKIGAMQSPAVTDENAKAEGRG